MKRIAILGSSGSIGRSALSLIKLYPERFEVVGLAAQSNREVLYRQCLEHQPSVAALFDRHAAAELSRQLPGVRVLSGQEGITEVACDPSVDLVLSSVSGAAGLPPTYEAIRAGKDVALANKETLVTAGELLMPMIEERQILLMPVDSEHSALHQCLRGSQEGEVKRLVLTASGGPFREWAPEDLRSVTIEQALNHPTWEMGPKITVDSATLMNKGLEVIEAHHLFQIPAEQIDVIIHPQSVVHSVVEFIDGTMLAQLSITDMRMALLYAFSYPERWETKLPPLTLSSLPSLDFSPPDTEKFPCLKLAYLALQQGQTFPTVLNAANEIAVGLFLEERLSFNDIPRVIEDVLEAHSPNALDTIEVVFEVDRWARQRARDIAGRLVSS